MSVPLLPLLALLGLGTPELLLVFGALLLLFGGSKLPSLAKGIGQSLREYRKAAAEATELPSAPPSEKPSE
jgi:sec-independent protein translocase protein TatA